MRAHRFSAEFRDEVIKEFITTWESYSCLLYTSVKYWVILVKLGWRNAVRSRGYSPRGLRRNIFMADFCCSQSQMAQVV